MPQKIITILILSDELQTKLYEEISTEFSTENILQCSFKQLGGDQSKAPNSV